MFRRLFYGVALPLAVMPLIIWASYEIRLPPPDEMKTTFLIDSHDNVKLLTDVRAYYWGDEKCFGRVFYEVTQDVATDMRYVEIIAGEDYFPFRDRVHDLLKLRLQERCRDTEILGWMFFYNFSRLD